MTPRSRGVSLPIEAMEVLRRAGLSSLDWDKDALAT